MPVKCLFDWVQALRRKPFDFEARRLHTFDQGWSSAPVDVRDLAAAGFSARGEDLVECHFCGGQLHQWKAGDIPWLDHRTYFPRCPFINGEATMNVPMFSSQDLNHLLDRQNQLNQCYLAVIKTDLTVVPISEFVADRGSRPLAMINKDWRIEFMHGSYDEVDF